jgi:hypothetical protein
MPLSVIRSANPRRWGALAAATVLLTGGIQLVPPSTAARAAAPADHVVYWNDVLLQTFREVGGPPGPLARAGAMMHIAMYDAANSVLCAQREADCLGQPFVVQVPGGGDFNAAVDQAAHDVLTAIYGATFADELQAARMGIPSSPARTAGAEVGRQAAQAMVQNRANDGSADQAPYTLDNVPGSWRPTGSGAAATPNWGNVRPFAMTSGSQFRPELPEGYDTYAQLLASPEYAEQFNEVKSLGRFNSTARTADQTEAAFFWANDLDSTYKPPGQLFEHTQIIAADQGVPVQSKVKLFAQVAIGMADAAILAWDSKYLGPVDLWRPESAIQQADTDNNSATARDLNWKPLAMDLNGVRFSPNFPAFVSGHATFAYTWAEVMKHWFGRDDIAFTGTTDDPHAADVERDFDGFSDAADENAHSRLWLGVHFHFDADNVLNPGIELGEFSVDNTLYYNSSDTELLYTHREDVTDPDACDDLGRQLSNEHRWEHWRCEFNDDETAFDLYVR